jgi:hypothetical protein
MLVAGDAGRARYLTYLAAAWSLLVSVQQQLLELYSSKDSSSSAAELPNDDDEEMGWFPSLPEDVYR